MLEVHRREILDDATNARIKKVLRLFDESDNSEKFCQLREEWERTEIEHGDLVNIIGKMLEGFYCSLICMLQSVITHRTQLTEVVNVAGCFVLNYFFVLQANRLHRALTS